MCPFCFYFCMQIMLKTDMENKKSLVGAWVEAARPRTLPASVSPVLLGCALAYYDGVFDVVPAVLCLLVALFAQIASNFANDYFDFKKGADREDRLGRRGVDHSEGHAGRHVRHIGIGLRGGFVAGLFRGLAADRGGDCDRHMCAGLFCRSFSFGL